MLSLAAISIYQIQYTTNPGRDNTYPSPLFGKTIVTEGIVTAVGYSAGGFFLSEPSGGPWRSLLVLTADYSVQPGDKVIIKGKVSEYFGMTCLTDVSAINRMDSNRQIPQPIALTSGQIISADQAEAYEGTLVRLQNATCVQGSLAGGRFSLNDGSGICYASSAFFTGNSLQCRTGQIFGSIAGIISYAYGEYTLNPRNKNDVIIMAPVFNQSRSWGRIKSIYK